MKKLKILALILALLFTSLHAADEPKEAPQIEQVAPDSSADVVAQERPAPPSYEGAFLKMVLSLILLLFVLFFGIWLIRRLSRGRLTMFREPKHIKIIDRRPLSAKTALYLVEVGDHRVLMAESQLEVKRLATIDLKTNVADT